MIVCDKCGDKAEYFLNVDYLRNKSIFQFDLCERHYQQLENWRNQVKSEVELEVLEEPEGSRGHAKKGKAGKSK